MKKWVVLCALVVGCFMAGYGQSCGCGPNGNGNGNGGANGAAGQEIPQPIVTQIAQLAAPIFGIPQGQLIHLYHIAECQIICLDPVNKVYRVTVGGGFTLVILADL
jgi:hypothetical protein